MSDSSAPILRAPTMDEIKAATTALRPHAQKTPLLSGPILIKAENLQHTGSFKFRGAFNRIRQLTETERLRGVIAYSSGNHAQAVAQAANTFGTHALIVMPADAPATKIARTKALGAEVITYDRATQTRENVAETIQSQRGMVMVPPNEDARVLAGAATVAMEMLDQAIAPIDIVLVPCGGGGLTAATALVFKARSPHTKVFAVEPELFNDTQRSIAAGERLQNPIGRQTICDAIMTDTPGALTFDINREILSGVLTVTDTQVLAAMAHAFEYYKIVVEPGAAVALAAALENQSEFSGKTIAAITTGGNVDADIFSAALTQRKKKT